MSDAQSGSGSPWSLFEDQVCTFICFKKHFICVAASWIADMSLPFILGTCCACTRFGSKLGTCE